MYTDAVKTASWGPELAKVIQEVFLCKVILKDQGGANQRKEEQERELLPERTASTKTLRY